MPREQVHAPEHDPHRSLGWLAGEWMQHFCVHGPGDVQGEKVKLDDELYGLTVDCYTVGKNGRRLYDSAFVSRAKGRDKSGHAARIALFEAFGPCRFTGFAKGGEKFAWRDFAYEYLPGEPMGRPVVSPFIRCIATEETQAGNTYDNIYVNLTDGPLAEGLGRDDAGVTRINIPGGGEIIPSTASNASKDGGKETFVVFDETHLYTLPELRKMYATVRRNMGAKRKQSEPWSLETSTMYLPGEGSVAEDTHKAAQLIMEGKARRSRILFDHIEAPPDVDLTDEAELRLALAEVYGPFIEIMDVDRVLSEIWDPRNDPQDSRRYYLNQPTSARDAWLAHYEWDARAAVREVKPGEKITLGFDGSRKRSRGVTDATALVGCTLDGHLFEVQVWEQPPDLPDWRVPTNEVVKAVEYAFSRWNVVGFYCDPAKWETYVADWEARWGAQLVAKATREHPCEWWMTGGRATTTVRALEQFHGAVIDGELTHAGDALSRHAKNARRRPSRSGVQIGKEHPESPKKIDAVVAAVLAWAARLDAVAKGAAQTDTTRGFAPRRIR
jgi:hypothetical protein